MAIIITRNGKNAKKIDKSDFEYEDRLQKYIDDNPESIPLYEIKEDIKVLILSREFNTTSGPIDALGIDREGDIYIVETKLFKNADKRKVVAQALDYGAALWKSTIDFSDFTQQIDNSPLNLDKRSTLQRISDYYNATPEDAGVILDRMRDNLNHGNLKFIILMDKMDDRLKDLILFVNENSKFDIYAVEFEYYKHDDFEIVIPKLYGAQVRKDISPGTKTGETWTEERFFLKAEENNGPSAARTLKQILDSIEAMEYRVIWGKGVTEGSFTPRIMTESGEISVFNASSNGTIQIAFGSFKARGIEYEIQDEFRKALNELPEIDISGTDIVNGKYPTINITKSLKDDNSTNMFLATVEGFIRAVRV